MIRDGKKDFKVTDQRKNGFLLGIIDEMKKFLYSSLEVFR